MKQNALLTVLGRRIHRVIRNTELRFRSCGEHQALGAEALQSRRRRRKGRLEGPQVTLTIWGRRRRRVIAQHRAAAAAAAESARRQWRRHLATHPGALAATSSSSSQASSSSCNVPSIYDLEPVW